MKKIVYILCLTLMFVFNYLVIKSQVTGLTILCGFCDILFVICSIIFFAKSGENRRVVPSDEPAVDEGRVYQVEGSFDDYKKK